MSHLKDVLAYIRGVPRATPSASFHCGASVETHVPRHRVLRNVVQDIEYGRDIAKCDLCGGNYEVYTDGNGGLIDVCPNGCKGVRK